MSLYSQIVATTDPVEHSRVILREVCDALETTLSEGGSSTRAASPLIGKVTDAIDRWREARTAADGRVELDADARTLALRVTDPARVRRALLVVGAGAAEVESVCGPLEALLARVKDREVREGAPFEADATTAPGDA